MFSALVYGPVTWDCKKQQIFLFLQQKQSIEQWLMQVKKPCGFQQILSEFGFQQQHLTTLWCDNQECHQAHQRSSSTSMQQTHRATHALH
jgi:hypothetical protein